ncbi:MAG: SDR family oxidoreductase [Pseudomonadota bacterium]
MKIPTTPSFRLDGKRALVTGGSSGIGLGCAAALAQAGAHVVVAARRVDQLNDTVDALTANGGSAEALHMDLADIGSITDAMRSQETFDVVVNSAGLAKHSAALEIEPEAYQTVMDVNVRGALFVSIGAAKAMVAAGKPGSIIHISSQMGHVGGIDRAVYCASKHAIEGMVKSLAIEWAPHKIRVNTLCPTFIRTPLAEQTLAIPERRKWIEEKIKLGRVGEIEDVMGGVLYLASDASSLVTGTSILIDGGWTAG